MINNTASLNNGSLILVMHLVLRLEIPMIPYMRTPLFDIRIIGMEVSNLAQPNIVSGSQPYEQLSINRGSFALSIMREISHVFSLKQIPS